MNRYIALAGILALILVAGVDPCSADMNRPLGVQGLIGILVIDEVEIASDGDGTDSTVTEGGRVEELISLGGIWQQSLKRYGGDSHFGVEYGFIFNYGVDDRRVTAANGVAVVSIDSSMMLLDGHTGLFVSQSIGGNARLYACGGPLLMWGRAEGDFVESRLEQETYITQTESDSTFGFGGYARAGIEFEWPSGGTFGVGARGFISSLNLDSVADDADIQGVQGYITFTQGF